MPSGRVAGGARKIQHPYGSLDFLFFGAYYRGVMKMTFDSAEMQKYYDSLPYKVRHFIDESGKISTMEELRQIGEHFRRELRSDSKY